MPINIEEPVPCAPPRNRRRERNPAPAYYTPGRAEDLIYRARRERALRNDDALDFQCIRGELRKAAEAYEYRRPDWWPSRFGSLNLRDEKHNLTWAGVYLRAETNRLEQESWDAESSCPVVEAALDDANWDLNRVTRKLNELLGVEDEPPPPPELSSPTQQDTTSSLSGWRQTTEQSVVCNVDNIPF